MLRKIISGGQSGVDSISLCAAKMRGIATGGWAPGGWLTTDGPKMELLRDHYGLWECREGFGYGPRTKANVRDSHGTLRIFLKEFSPGEILTLKWIKFYKKPFFDVDLNKKIDPSEVSEWVKRNKIEVLNVAGNSDKTDNRVSGMSLDFMLDFIDNYQTGVKKEIYKITLTDGVLVKEVLPWDAPVYLDKVTHQAGTN